LALRRLEQKLTKENLWIYILHLLRGGPLYAYEIRGKIRAAFGFEPATITVYVVLYKMEGEGLVTSAAERRTPSNIVRKYYRLTETGLQALENGRKILRRTLDLLETTEPVKRE
jgi:DNA-binding PadR family transcriptional regulator